MNAKVILVKDDIEKAVQLLDNCILTTTKYKTMFDAEGVYSMTKANLKKKGWRAKPAAVISKIENVGRRRRSYRVLGRFVGGNGTVGE